MLEWPMRILVMRRRKRAKIDADSWFLWAVWFKTVWFGLISLDLF